jgi:predicted transcriptional regulator
MGAPTFTTGTDAAFGEAVRRARRSVGVNRRDLASIAGVGLNTLARLENGRVAPNRSTRLLVLAALCTIGAYASDVEEAA